MEETRTWTVALADGTLIENLTLGGNNFQSETEITADIFDGNLSEVHISASDGDMTGCAYSDTLHTRSLCRLPRPRITRMASGGSFCGNCPKMNCSKCGYGHSLITSP